MNFVKQRVILEYLLSSKDLYARCSGIIKPEYFDVELRRAVHYLEQYYSEYHTLPKLDRFKVEFDLDFEQKAVDMDDFAWISTEVEQFAIRSAIKDAINKGLKNVNEGKYDGLVQDVLDAVKISLDRDVGIDLYDDPLANLERAKEAVDFVSTGIAELDEKLGGGLVRKQFTLFSANSGVGKSVMMSNIGDNLAAAGYHVCYISLELSEEMVLTRLASIATGHKAKEWKENIHQIAHKLGDIKEAGAGSYVIKRMKNGSNANDIRAYLKQYELIFERKPDVIIVDYLDIMTPNGGIGNMPISEQDKAKSEQLYEIGVDYNAVMLSASQQNRSGIQQSTPDQAVIAGGFSKINIVDNYISIYMTPQMRLEGLMMLYYLKTRSSSAVGSNSTLKFNRDTLQITDLDDEGKARAAIQRLSNLKEIRPDGKKKKDDKKTEVVTRHEVINDDIPGLPFATNSNEPETIEEDSPEALLELMGFLQTK